MQTAPDSVSGDTGTGLPAAVTRGGVVAGRCTGS